MVKNGESDAFWHGTRDAGLLAYENPCPGRPVEGLTRSNNIQGFYLAEEHCFATGQCPVDNGS